MGAKGWPIVAGKCQVCGREADYVDPDDGGKGHDWDCPIQMGL